MRNFIAADLRRLSRRKPRLILLFVIYAVSVALLMFFKGTTTWNSVSLIQSANNIFTYCGIAIGVVEILIAYASDFKSKLMQLAIGTGIVRRKLVLAKLIEIFTLEAFSMHFLYIIAVIFGLITGVALTAAQYGELMVCLVTSIIGNIIYTTLSSFFIFLTQNAGLTALFYVLCLWDPLTTVLSILGQYQRWILNYNLTNYCYSTSVNLFKAHLMLGQFNFGALVRIILYLIIFYLATVFVFEKKELEF